MPSGHENEKKRSLSLEMFGNHDQAKMQYFVQFIS